MSPTDRLSRQEYKNPTTRSPLHARVNPRIVTCLRRTAGAMEAAVIIAALESRAGNLTTEATYVDLGAAGGGTTGGSATPRTP